MDLEHTQKRSVREFRSSGAVFLFLAALLFGLAGCSSMREKPVFSMGLEATPQAQRLTFPPASDGEVPRYAYLGELRGETNISRTEEFGDGLMNSVFRILDIIAGPAAPIVMDRPQTGAVDARDRVFVTDIGRGSIFMFDETVPEVKTWFKAEGLTDFISPVGIALGPEGQIFVADADLALIARLGPNGETLPSIGRGHLQRPNGIAFDPVARKIFVADTTAHQVKIFDLEGNLLAELGTRGEDAGEFNHPTHIAIANDKLYVTDTMNARVQVFSTRSGAYLATLGKRGMVVGNFSRPKGVAVDSEENVYVVESYFDYLLIFNRKGQFLMPLGGTGTGPGQLHLPSGVWIDSRNRVYVADMLNSRVSVFQFLGGGSENE